MEYSILKMVESYWLLKRKRGELAWELQTGIHSLDLAEIVAIKDALEAAVAA